MQLAKILLSVLEATCLTSNTFKLSLMNSLSRNSLLKTITLWVLPKSTNIFLKWCMPDDRRWTLCGTRFWLVEWRTESGKSRCYILWVTLTVLAFGKVSCICRSSRHNLLCLDACNRLWYPHCPTFTPQGCRGLWRYPDRGTSFEYHRDEHESAILPRCSQFEQSNAFSWLIRCYYWQIDSSTKWRRLPMQESKYQTLKCRRLHGRLRRVLEGMELRHSKLWDVVT